MLAACAAAQAGTVLSSRAFVERAKLGPVVARMEREVRFLWLEDVRAGLGQVAKLRGVLDTMLARRLPGARVVADAPAVVLFTSGSEGAPKGVVLSHRNILANIAQVASVVDFNATDRVFNAMPMFHSFGLTGGTLLPLLSGVRTFFYPSPLHYRIVPELIYDTDSTIAFGTDTFLTGWARFAHPYDFYAMRYIFSGAEKLRDDTRRLYAERFGVRVLEGYGATETSPVLALNSPMHSRPGAAGRLLPGIEHRLDPVEGIAEGGRLMVRGPNVMLGYLRASAPGVLEPLADGWYDTGDICAVDAEGFVTIVARAKRFAQDRGRDGVHAGGRGPGGSPVAAGGACGAGGAGRSQGGGTGADDDAGGCGVRGAASACPGTRGGGDRSAPYRARGGGAAAIGHGENRLCRGEPAAGSLAGLRSAQPRRQGGHDQPDLRPQLRRFQAGHLLVQPQIHHPVHGGEQRAGQHGPLGG